jgi:hypothetical protein
MNPGTPNLLYTKEVEVIQVTRAVESHTGESIFQVQFGEVIEVDEELRRFVPAAPFSKPQRFVYPAALTLFIKSEKPLPYKVGSRWVIRVQKDGRLSLEGVEKENV